LNENNERNENTKQKDKKLSEELGDVSPSPNE